MRYLAWICAAGIACAQGTEPKPKADDYEVHTAAKGVTLGAEYMVYSVSGQGATFILDGHLVVEVGLFPPKGKTVAAGASEFQLRVDGKTLHPLTPQMVVAAQTRREWYHPRGIQATAGSGNDTVILGAPTRQTPPYGGGRTTPAPPRSPEPDLRDRFPRSESVRADELIVSTAFPHGEFKGPVSGYIYFPFTGKASKIRRVDLLYGDAVLRLK
jgi:hypothetical protein